MSADSVTVGIDVAKAHADVANDPGSNNRGRFKIRRALYMAALTVSRRNPSVKTFYGPPRRGRQTAQERVELAACMRKLLSTLNAMVLANKQWGNSLYGA